MVFTRKKKDLIEFGRKEKLKYNHFLNDFSVRNEGFPVVRANQIFCRTTTISQAVVCQTTSSLKSIGCNKEHISWELKEHVKVQKKVKKY